MIHEKTQYVDTCKKILELVPKNSVIAEIGVLRGDFSEQIKKICSPRRLYLIDCWEKRDDIRFIYDPCNDGNEKTHEENYELILKKYMNEDNVKIIKAYSSFACKLFVKNYFDMVFIDASKYAEDVLEDFSLWYPLVKNQGFICGCNYENTEDEPFVEVKKAIDLFCKEHNVYLNYITFEKKSMFAISKPRLKMY